MTSRFIRVSEKKVYANQYVEVFDDIVRRPDGARGTYFRVGYHGNRTGVVIVPVMPDGRLLLLRVHRYATQSLSWEFPRGNTEPGEKIIAAAARELREETGLNAKKLGVLGHMHPDAAILMTRVTAVLAHIASDCVNSSFRCEEEAIVKTKAVTSTELWEMAASGKVNDGFTLASMALLQSHHTARPARARGSGTKR